MTVDFSWIEPASRSLGAGRGVIDIRLRKGSRIERETGERRVGIFGGTFNPIHVGHLRGAEEIRESFALAEVTFIPAAIPPHKGMDRVADAAQRLEMVRLAVGTNPYFSVSDIELKRTGKSYSIDTIRHFREIHPGPLFFILGEDAFGEIETWREFKNLFSLCHFIVMTRSPSRKRGGVFGLPESVAPFFRYDPAVRAWVHASGNRLHLKEITFLDISSTKIREGIERGESVRYLIAAETEAYIRTKGLYRKKN